MSSTFPSRGDGVISTERCSKRWGDDFLLTLSVIDTPLWYLCRHLQHLGMNVLCFFFFCLFFAFVICNCTFAPPRLCPGSPRSECATARNACATYGQSIFFPASEPTNHNPPSSPFIMHSWVSVSAGLWLAPNEQMTALSLSQCFDNKISQSVQKKHQSTTGTETSFNQSATAENPWGRLTYWISLTAWYLWYDSHNTSYLVVIKCTHLQ